MLFVIRVTLVQSRYDVAFFKPGSAHNFKLGAHYLDCHEALFCLVDFGGLYNAGEHAFACDVEHLVATEDYFSSFRLIVTIFVN